jgi:hypothetical protein
VINKIFTLAYRTPHTQPPNYLHYLSCVLTGGHRYAPWHLVATYVHDASRYPLERVCDHCGATDRAPAPALFGDPDVDP